jgi:hypothetical protein
MLRRSATRGGPMPPRGVKSSYVLAKPPNARRSASACSTSCAAILSARIPISIPISAATRPCLGPSQAGRHFWLRGFRCSRVHRFAGTDRQEWSCRRLPFFDGLDRALKALGLLRRCRVRQVRLEDFGSRSACCCGASRGRRCLFGVYTFPSLDTSIIGGNGDQRRGDLASDGAHADTRSAARACSHCRNSPSRQ